MNGRLRVRTWMMAALAVALLILSFRETDLPEVLRVLSGVEYMLILAAVPILILSHVFRAWRWRLMLTPAGCDASLGHLFSALMAGYAINNVLPRAGELYRPYALSRLDGVPYATALATVMLDRILDVLMFLTVFSMVPVIYSGPIRTSVPWLQGVLAKTAVAMVLILGGLILLFVFRERVCGLLASVGRRRSTGVLPRVTRAVGAFLAGLALFRESRTAAGVLILTVVIWGLYILLMYVAFFAFDMSGTYALGPGAAVVVQSFSCIGILVPTPGSTGSYHFFVIQALTLLYGVSAETAAAYAIVTHAIGFTTGTVIGLYCFYSSGTGSADSRFRKIPPREWSA